MTKNAIFENNCREYIHQVYTKNGYTCKCRVSQNGNRCGLYIGPNNEVVKLYYGKGMYTCLSMDLNIGDIDDTKKIIKGIFGKIKEPDALLYINDGTHIQLLMIECRYQESAGSVDEKFIGEPLIQKEYKKLLKEISFNYVYVVNDYFHIYDDSLFKTLKDEGVGVFYNYVPGKIIGLNDIKLQLLPVEIDEDNFEGLW